MNEHESLAELHNLLLKCQEGRVSFSDIYSKSKQCSELVSNYFNSLVDLIKYQNNEEPIITSYSFAMDKLSELQKVSNKAKSQLNRIQETAKRTHNLIWCIYDKNAQLTNSELVGLAKFFDVRVVQVLLGICHEQIQNKNKVKNWFIHDKSASKLASEVDISISDELDNNMDRICLKGFYKLISQIDNICIKGITTNQFNYVADPENIMKLKNNW